MRSTDFVSEYRAAGKVSVAGTIKLGNQFKDTYQVVNTPISHLYEVRIDDSPRETYPSYYFYNKDTGACVGSFSINAMPDAADDASPIVQPGVQIVQPHMTLAPEVQGKGLGSLIYDTFLAGGNWLFATFDHSSGAGALWDRMATKGSNISVLYNFNSDSVVEPGTKQAQTAVRILGPKERFKNKQGVAEGTYRTSDFKINAYESMGDFRKWMRGPKKNDRGMTRHIVDIYENIVVNDNILTEVSRTFKQRKQEATSISNNFKQFDKREQVQIKLGNKIALLSCTVIPDDKSSRIELSGFTTPKKIVKINLDTENKIDSIKFDDGSVFPEAAEFTTVGGVNITNTIFFPNDASASKAYTAIWMYIGNLEGKGWKVERYMSEDLAEDRENYGGVNMLLQADDDEVFVKASAGSRELGHVLFTIDYDSQGMVLNPQDLEVEEKYRGQGIAETMYDYVKSKGYRIRRSGQQTDAGAAFWNKHRPGQNVWEQDEQIQGVAEGRARYKEIEFVCANPDMCDATDPVKQQQLYKALTKIPGVIALYQDQSEYSEGQMSLSAIFKDPQVKKQILQTAKQFGVAVDLEQPVDDNYVDRAIRGEHYGQIQDVAEVAAPPGVSHFVTQRPAYRSPEKVSANHRVGITYTDGASPETLNKIVRVTADSPEEAIKKSTIYFKRLGWNVVDAAHLGTLDEAVAEELEEGWKDWVAGGAMALGALGAQASDIVSQLVEPGDTVYSIARQNNVHPSVLYKLNGFNNNTKLTPGQEVKVPDVYTQTAKPAAKAPTAKPAIAQGVRGAVARANALKPVAKAQPKAQPKAAPVAAKVAPITGSKAEQLLMNTAVRSGITGTELAAFMAQMAHESDNFKSMKEYGGSLDFRKYDPKYAPKKAKTLGNKYAGDGNRFKGRGFIQITGRYNYRIASKAIGVDLVKNPKLAEDPAVAAKIAVWYWKLRVQPNVTNWNDVEAVTKPINPGLRGLEDRKENFADYITAMATVDKAV